MMQKGSFNITFGLDLIKRFDKPSVVDVPFDGDSSYKWAVRSV